MFKEYIELDAIGISELIKQKQIHPKEVLETAIHFVEKYNLLLNAVTNTHYELALKQLENLDYTKPFSGVPFLLKDLGVQYKDTVTTNACKLFTSYKSPENDELTKRFINLGLNIIGKTNTPEFGFSSVVSESKLFGPCRNPWNPELTPGGSSGGSAAAVAARMVPIAHASDAGGSIRIPASCCGIIGLKPTRGRTPCGPDLGEIWAGLATNYVLTRSVRDCALMLDELCFTEVGTPYHTKNPDISYSESIGQKPKKLRIAYSHDFIPGFQVHPECKTAVEEAAKLCSSLGHFVESAAPIWDYEQMVKCGLDLICAHFTNVVNMIEAHVRVFNKERKNTIMKYATLFYQHLNFHFLDGYFEKTTRLFLEHGRKLSAIDYCSSLNTMHKISRNIGSFFEDYDIFISPVTCAPALKLDGIPRSFKSVNEYIDAQWQFAPYTFVFNQTGQPAISLPLYWTIDNIPIGVQFASKFGNEDILLQLARQFEIERPWINKKPPYIKQN